MLKPVGRREEKTLHEQRKPREGARKRILDREIVWDVTRSECKISCKSIRERRGRQDYNRGRVNYDGTGEEVGDHVAN